MTHAPILIIEDDIDQLTLLASMLEDGSRPVITALNGRRALEILEEQTPALIITDMVMPDISGSLIINSVRGNERFQQTKIIIATSFLRYVSPEDQALADRVLVKPIKKDELRQAVRDLIGE